MAGPEKYTKSGVQGLVLAPQTGTELTVGPLATYQFSANVIERLGIAKISPFVHGE